MAAQNAEDAKYSGEWISARCFEYRMGGYPIVQVKVSTLLELAHTYLIF